MTDSQNDSHNALDPDVTADLPSSASLPPDSLDAGLAAAFGRPVAPRSSLGDLRPVQLKEAEGESSHVVKPKSDAIPPAEMTGDRYQLDGEIARGGMGAVLRGRDLDLGRDLAVKVLLEKYSNRPDVARRFVEEAQIGGQLQHPGVVPVYDIGRFGDRPFFTMKLVKGNTLAHILGSREQPTDDLPRLLGIALKVSEALAFAHAKGVIHRDLKPSNVMVGAFGEVQVMDWGLAKVLAEGGMTELARANPVIEDTEDVTTIRTARSSNSAEGLGTDTEMGALLGTPSYMPPEQANGDVAHLDRRADVFGLGAILCEILTGKPPYVGRSSEEIRRKAANGNLDDARLRLDECGADAELIALTKACLSPEAIDRPRDAQAVADGLSAYLESVQERLHTAQRERAVAVTKEAEQRKRRKVQAVLGMTFTALVVMGGAFAWWTREQSQLRATEERDRLAAVERDVNRSIEVAVARYAQARGADKDLALWAEARAAALQARGRATEAGATAEVQDRITTLITEIEQVEKNRRLVATLLEIQASRGDQIQPDGNQDFAGADTSYFQAFSDYSSNLFESKPDAIADLLRTLGGTRTVELAAALDDWEYVMIFSSKHRDLRMNIFQITSRLDPDPVRNQLRKAISTADKPTLIALADKIDPAKHPVQTVNLIAVYMNYFLGQLEYEHVIKYLLRAQPHHPDDFQINHNLAWTLNRINRFEESIRYCLAAIAIRPKSATAWFMLAGALHGIRQYDEAASAYRRVGTLSPDSAIAFRNLGRILDHQGDRSGAIEAWRHSIVLWAKAVQKNPTRGRFVQALSDDSVTLGNAYLEMGELEEAIAQFRGAVAANPENAAAKNQLTATSALTAIRDKIPGYLSGEYTPANNDERIAIARWSRLQKQYRTATRAYSEAFASDPGLADTTRTVHRYNAACCAALAATGKGEDSDQFDDAERTRLRTLARTWLRADLDQLAKLLDSNHPADRTDAYRKLEVWKEDPDLAGIRDPEALAKLTSDEQQAFAKLWVDQKQIWLKAEAIVTNAQLATAHTNTGIQLRTKGAWNDAIISFRKAVELDPTNASAHDNLGHALRTIGQWKEAIECFKKATELDPKYSQAQDNLGHALWTFGNLKEAVECFRKSIAANQQNMLTRYNLATCLLDQNDVVGALAAFDVSDLPFDASYHDLHSRCWIAIATLAVWYDRTEEYEAICTRALSLAKETTNPVIAERVAKISSLRPTNEAQQTAALELGRRAVELGKNHNFLVYFRLALGITEYRAGKFADAVKTLARFDPPTDKSYSRTAAFYLAMSLYQSGEQDRARKLAEKAAEMMRPVPNATDNPLKNVNADELIMWFAYREAKELMGFAEAPEKKD